jgi:hypothetical protein
MPRSAIKLLYWIVLVFVVFAAPLFATRVKDGGSSSNGVGPFSLCPDSHATPFFARLDGSQQPPSGCAGEDDPNQPNPPATYPNRIVVLSGNGFTVTITPALWQRGDGQIQPISASKATIFQVTFTGQSGMTLQSLVIGSQLNLATGPQSNYGSYVVCDPNNLGAIPECVSSPLLNPNSFPSVLEPTAIALSDTTTTRWDFSQLTDGNSLTLLVAGFPSEFAGIDNIPNSNSLAPTSFSASNFLAVVKDASNKTLTAGGLALSTARVATNDLFANATAISSSPFSDFIDTSTAEPQEILSGNGAGGQLNPQQDPIPQDPNPVNLGTPCAISWPSGSNRVFRSVWYKFSAAAGGSVTISTDGTRYDTGVYVFTGSTSNPVTVACNDDGINSSFSIQSSDVTFTASSGQTYYIMVSEVPPPVGQDQNSNAIADPLANDATLKFSLVANGVIGPPANPVPYVDIVSPVSAPPASQISQLTIQGTGFVNGATVNFDGAVLPTSTVSSNQIVVTGVPAPVGAVTASLSVSNPNITPHVGTSNLTFFPVSNPTPSISLGRQDLTSGGGYSPISADFNGDGKLDIVSANVSSAVSVLLGNGDGTFQSQQQYTTGTQPISIVQGDFNGDGKIDLAVANEGGGTGGNVSILLGNGDGSFQTHHEYAAGNVPNSVIAGDFNGDGFLDLAVANFGSSNVSVLLGVGDGSFPSHVEYSVSMQPISVATGDFNGDGKLDLVLAGGTSISVLLGNGDGTFQPASTTTFSGIFPVWLTTGDFNGDGKLDIAIANAAANSISTLLGNGNGTFQAKVDYPIGSYAYSIAVGDLNADGALDLVVGSIASQVPVLFGKGNGTFQNPAGYSSGFTNGAVTLGDLNNDGRLDVIPSLSSGTSVMLQVPVVSLSSTSLNFGTHLVGTSTTKQVTVTNTGSVPLDVSSVVATGNYSETNNCQSGVAPGAVCTISIKFKPTAKGTRSGTVTLTDNANPNTQTVTLTGTGTVVKLSPTSINFGSQKVGTRSAAKTITLTNIGKTFLSITNISITGTNKPDFSGSNTCATGIAAGASCTIAVKFQPSATGTRTAAVSISDNGGGSPQKVSLIGTGT